MKNSCAVTIKGVDSNRTLGYALCMTNHSTNMRAADGYSICIANGGMIWASQLRAYALEVGRVDLAQRLEALKARGCRYSGEDGDTLASVWSALGWPRLDIVGGVQ